MRPMPGAKPLYAAVLACAVVLAGAWLAERFGLFDRDLTVTQAAIGAHCLDCHDDITRSGGLLLEPATLADVGGHTEVWEKVVRKIADRAMPPADEPRPPEQDYLTIERFLVAELDALAAARPNPGELPQLHRLTRTEYRNAIRDLLELDGLPAELDFELLLPADNRSSGFDNISELLFVSPSNMERYIDTARKISRLAVGDMSTPLLVNRHRMALQLPQDTHLPGLPIGTRGGLLVDSFFPLDGEYVVRVEFAGGSREPHELEVLVNGERIAATTVVTGGRGFPRRPPPLPVAPAARRGPRRGRRDVHRTQRGLRRIDAQGPAQEPRRAARHRTRHDLRAVQSDRSGRHAEPRADLHMHARGRTRRARLRSRDPRLARTTRIPAAGDRRRSR